MRKFATIQTHEQTIQTLKDLCAVYGSNNWFSKVLIRLLKFCKRDPMKFWHRSTEMNTIKKRTSAKEFRIMGYKVDRSRKKGRYFGFFKIWYFCQKNQQIKHQFFYFGTLSLDILQIPLSTKLFFIHESL